MNPISTMSAPNGASNSDTETEMTPHAENRIAPIARTRRAGFFKARPLGRVIASLAVALLLVAALGCYNNNTGETHIGESIRFKLPAFPETGAHAVQVFTEMHYQPSYRSQEGPRLDVPASAVPITGKEVIYTSVEEYAALENPGGDSANGAALYNINCVVCHGAGMDGQGVIMERENITMVPADLMGEITLERTDGELYGLISYGGNTGFTTRVAALADPTQDGERCVGQGSCPMPEFRRLLTEEERWDLVTYLRGMQGR